MAEQIKHHEPIDVHRLDGFVFVKCSCGRNPTPTIWLEEHFGGTDDLGKALLDAVIARQTAATSSAVVPDNDAAGVTS